MYLPGYEGVLPYRAADGGVDDAVMLIRVVACLLPYDYAVHRRIIVVVVVDGGVDDAVMLKHPVVCLLPCDYAVHR